MKMKRLLQIALAAMILFAACSKEDETPPPLSQEQEVQEATAAVEDAVDDGYITLEEARKDLESILADFTTLSKSGNGGFPARKIADGFTLKSIHPSLSKSTGVVDTAKIHVFNFEDNSGFAIMSATTEMPSLLAITEGGNIDTNEVIDNPGLVIFLSNLETKCELSKQNNENVFAFDTISYSSPYTISKKISLDKFTTERVYSNKFYNPRSGYCKVHWHQREPFNAYCYYNETEHAPVGCVAVACAQLMSIYKYPKSYQGRTLHWEEMLVNNKSDDIAWLMRRLGDSTNLDMAYGKNNSTAYYKYVSRTFTNFGYSNGGSYTKYVEKDICRELKNRYPVLLCGFSHQTSKSSVTTSVFGVKTAMPTYSNGHQWLAHGLLVRTETRFTYKGSDESILKKLTLVSKQVYEHNYILCNFGWGYNTTVNGYYLSGIFDTNKGADFSEDTPISKSGTPYYYQYDMRSIINIRK